MKNKGIFKVLGIALLVVILLTWVIPSSIISGGITIGKIAPTGIADIFSSIEVLNSYFMSPGIYILFVGMFYGVANASGSLKALVNKIVSIFKNKKWLFVVLTVLFYSILTAFTGIYVPTLIFVPLSIAVLFGLKYNKVQAILATVGASTIGLLGQVFNSNAANIVSGKDNYLLFKAGLLTVLVILTIIYILKVSIKKDKTEKSEDSVMFVPENRSVEKKVTVKGISLFIVMCLLFVVFVLGLTPWDTDIFEKAYDAIKNVKIGNFAVFSSILGAFNTFGTWSYNELYTTIALAIIVISISNHMKFGEMIESCVEGAKKLMGVAILAILINLILVFTLNSGFIATIINLISKNGRTILAFGATFVGSPFMVDINYALQYLLSCLVYSTDKQDLLNLYALFVQFAFGFVSLIAPSSVLLMVGLSYVEESYSKWFKYIWKFLICVLIAISITLALVKFIK